MNQEIKDALELLEEINIRIDLQLEKEHEAQREIAKLTAQKQACLNILEVNGMKVTM